MKGFITGSWRPFCNCVLKLFILCFGFNNLLTCPCCCRENKWPRSVVKVRQHLMKTPKSSSIDFFPISWLECRAAQRCHGGWPWVRAGVSWSQLNLKFCKHNYLTLLVHHYFLSVSFFPPSIAHYPELAWWFLRIPFIFHPAKSTRHRRGELQNWRAHINVGLRPEVLWHSEIVYQSAESRYSV